MVDKAPFITTTQGMKAWFAVHVWWNPEGFWEPYDTGLGRYLTEEEAIVEARIWATMSGIEYKPRNSPPA